MCLCQRTCLIYIVIAEFLICSKVFADVVIEPGVGIGAEYTDNAGLTRDDRVNDTITMGYVGARISESEGALGYEAAASFNNQHYTQDTFSDQRYFNLIARADWEMIQDRFNWFLSDSYSQLPVFSIESNTPDNIQDSNVFNFGADILFPVSERQGFSFVPMFSQYYYEVLFTDNKQYSLAAIWDYKMSRLTTVGLSLSARKINYTEIDLFGRSIEDTVFTSLGFTFNGQRIRSTFTGSLGATNVERENGAETTGFSGFLNWLTDLSSRSKFETLVSSELTDSSSVAASEVGNDVQITADVIRNSIINLAYLREDESLRTRISARYQKLSYSESPFDSVIRNFDLEFSYPVTQLLSSGAYVNFNSEERLDTNRLDDRFTVGGNLRYNFSRKIHGLLDLKYREKESTLYSQNYDEFSVFASIVYGFGEVLRPTRVGGF